MSEQLDRWSRRGGSALLGAVLAALLLSLGCRNGPEPTQLPPPVSPPHGADDKPPPPAGAATSGVVDGVSWMLVHRDGEPDRLVIGSGPNAVTVVLQKNPQGCYSSDRIHGVWCQIEEMARSLIKFDPDIATLRAAGKI
jgi:hypothetical protein